MSSSSLNGNVPLKLHDNQKQTFVDCMSVIKQHSPYCLIADLLWCYKIVFNVVDISIDEFFCFNICTYTC